MNAVKEFLAAATALAAAGIPSVRLVGRIRRGTLGEILVDVVRMNTATREADGSETLDMSHCACPPCEGCTARELLLRDLLHRVERLEAREHDRGES